MEDEDYKRYVCVEPGCVNGMTTVEAKKELVLMQTIVVVKEMWVVCWILITGKRKECESRGIDHMATHSPSLLPLLYPSFSVPIHSLTD